MSLIFRGHSLFDTVFKSALVLCVFFGMELRAEALTSPRPWELTVLFLGGSEDEAFQNKVDANIKELLSLKSTPQFSIAVLREMPETTVVYLSKSASTSNSIPDSVSNSGKALYFIPPTEPFETRGSVTVLENKDTRPGSILSDPERLRHFFSNQAFRRTDNPRRFLVIYGHGYAFDGFKRTSLLEFRSNMEIAMEKKLDILWLDACFMANLETLYELRNLTSFIVGSEEAEFSEASPFEGLQRLSDGNPETGAEEPSKEIAIGLAEEYLESYSYLKKGSQRKAVKVGSATISVIETNLLAGLVQKVKAAVEKITIIKEEQKKWIFSSLIPLTMKNNEVVDFGNFLLKVRENSSFPELLREASAELVRLLDLNHQKRIKSNPRLRVLSPQPDQLLVYGFNEWTRGFKNDPELPMTRLPKNLQPELFVERAETAHSWPARKIKKRLDLIPFLPDVKSFQYYIAAPGSFKPLTEIREFERSDDLYAYRAKNPENPVLFTGYTQGVGSKGEHYTGLSILNPLLIQKVSRHYPELSFVRETNWGGVPAPP